MFLGCDGFNHMLAVYRHSRGIISAWRWIVQNREKGENLNSLFKNIPERKMTIKRGIRKDKGMVLWKRAEKISSLVLLASLNESRDEAN